MKFLFALFILPFGFVVGAETPGRFARQAPMPAVDFSTWWKAFGDAPLNRLVEAALAGNPSLLVAEARVREARQKRLAAAADWWPQVRGSGGIMRDQQSGGSRFGGFAGFAAPQTMYDAGLDASWEIDVFGRIRYSVKAAAADAQAAEEARRDVLISLLAEVAANYVDLRGLQQQLIVLEDNIASQQKTVELTKSRVKAGLSPELVVAQAETLLANSRAAAPSVEAAIAEAMHRLATLTGKPPGALIAELSSPKAIPAGAATVPAGLPSELLLRRPDVRRAEREFAAAKARVGAARAERLPRFTISTQAGFESAETGTLIEEKSKEWSVGPRVSIPLFTGGKLKANQRAAEAGRDQAQAAWDQAVLTALEDVESALVVYRKSQERLTALNDAEKASSRALQLAQDLYKNGLGDFLNVLEAQRSVLAAQEQVVGARRSVSLNLVKLYKALGGGWESATIAPQPADSASRSR